MWKNTFDMSIRIIYLLSKWCWWSYRNSTITKNLLYAALHTLNKHFCLNQTIIICKYAMPFKGIGASGVGFYTQKRSCIIYLSRLKGCSCSLMQFWNDEVDSSYPFFARHHLLVYSANTGFGSLVWSLRSTH